MPSKIDSYKLGDIEVSISETDQDNKLEVVCNDGNYRSAFTIRRYEYNNYKRHMNQRIKNAYKEQYKNDAPSEWLPGQPVYNCVFNNVTTFYQKLIIAVFVFFQQRLHKAFGTMGEHAER